MIAVPPAKETALPVKDSVRQYVMETAKYQQKPQPAPPL